MMKYKKAQLTVSSDLAKQERKNQCAMKTKNNFNNARMWWNQGFI